MNNDRANGSSANAKRCSTITFTPSHGTNSHNKCGGSISSEIIRNCSKRNRTVSRACLVSITGGSKGMLYRIYFPSPTDGIANPIYYPDKSTSRAEPTTSSRCGHGMMNGILLTVPITTSGTLIGRPMRTAMFRAKTLLCASSSPRLVCFVFLRCPP